MKKILSIILAAVVIVGVALGVFFGVKSCSNTDANGTTYKVSHIKDEYDVGDNLVVRVLVTSDVEMTKMTYVLNNGTETAFTVKHGESKDAEDTVGKGKYYIDTDVVIIDTSEMSAGWYTLVIYTYDANQSRYVVTAKPIIFKLNAIVEAE